MDQVQLLNRLNKLKKEELNKSEEDSPNGNIVLLFSKELKPKDFASQITLRDEKLLAEITPEDLCRYCFENKNCSNLLKIIETFNNLTHLIVQEVLSGKSAKERGTIIAFYLLTARRLHRLRNLHSEYAIFCALQSQQITKLQDSWKEVPSRIRRIFKKQAFFFSFEKNFQKYRTYLGKTALPCIPFIGFFLKDLSHIYQENIEAGDGIMQDFTYYQQSYFDLLLVLPDIQEYICYYNHEKINCERSEKSTIKVSYSEDNENRLIFSLYPKKNKVFLNKYFLVNIPEL